MPSSIEGLQPSSKYAIAVLNNSQITRFAKSITRFKWIFDTFEESLMYPEKELEPTIAANFFFFMVAIDHRTHKPGQMFKGVINGTELAGAELLWALAKKRLDEDMAFFTPEHLSNVSPTEIAELFEIGEPDHVQVAGPEERAALLRDCASKLMNGFGGSILNLISASRRRLVREDGRGFLQLLKLFEAYKDPLNKKSFLLAKFLERRRFLVVSDPENLHVPLDNILLRLALRTGIVRLTRRELEQKIQSGVEVAKEEELTLRALTIRAYDKICSRLGMNATYLDDILWEFGRIHCRVPIPICDSLPSSPNRRPYRMIQSGPVGECPFGVGCLGYMKPEVWKLKEPNVKTLFY